MAGKLSKFWHYWTDQVHLSDNTEIRTSNLSGDGHSFDDSWETETVTTPVYGTRFGSLCSVIFGLGVFATVAYFGGRFACHATTDAIKAHKQERIRNEKTIESNRNLIEEVFSLAAGNDSILERHEEQELIRQLTRLDNSIYHRKKPTHSANSFELKPTKSSFELTWKIGSKSGNFYISTAKEYISKTLIERVYEIASGDDSVLDNKEKIRLIEELRIRIPSRYKSIGEWELNRIIKDFESKDPDYYTNYSPYSSNGQRLERFLENFSIKQIGCGIAYWEEKDYVFIDKSVLKDYLKNHSPNLQQTFPPK